MPLSGGGGWPAEKGAFVHGDLSCGMTSTKCIGVAIALCSVAGCFCSVAGSRAPAVHGAVPVRCGPGRYISSVPCKFPLASFILRLHVSQVVASLHGSPCAVADVMSIYIPCKTFCQKMPRPSYTRPCLYTVLSLSQNHVCTYPTRERSCMCVPCTASKGWTAARHIDLAPYYFLATARASERS